jgi:hypothetical protein
MKHEASLLEPYRLRVRQQPVYNVIAGAGEFGKQ